MIQQNFFKIMVSSLVLFGVVFWAASYFVDQQQKQIVDAITIQLLEQEKTLGNLAEITDRDGADAVVEKIVQDCSAQNRNRFDTLLNTLGTLDRAGLAEAKQLFDGCARFFSQRKALMVARLEREYEVYVGLVEVLTIADDAIAVASFTTDEWGALVEMEKKRSELFTRQADVQLQIIDALQAGQIAGSESISTLTNEAKNISEEVVVLNTQIDQLRPRLLDI